MRVRSDACGTDFAEHFVFTDTGASDMTERNQGEGNREADRRYRKGVRKTVEQTTEQERAENARELTGEERDQALEAERAGKSKARPGSNESDV
jgi:hypothetical protein